MSAPVEEEGPVGKGRPTPKRRDAERRRRQPVAAPKDRKEQREAARVRRKEAGKAVRTGNVRKLPARDEGPVRAFVRDFVDSRRTAGTYFLPAIIVVFGLALSAQPVLRIVGNSLMLAFLAAVAFESVRLGRAVVTEVSTRFPKEPTRGLKSYAISRSLNARRLRFPKPRVQVGNKI